VRRLSPVTYDWVIQDAKVVDTIREGLGLGRVKTDFLGKVGSGLSN